MNNKIKQLISIISFLAAIVIGFIALFIPPTGIIDASVLWFTAQLLVFTSGVLGIDISIDSLKRKADTHKNIDI
jgi:ABC-type anion transport system duplicated permease subunit